MSNTSKNFVIGIFAALLVLSACTAYSPPQDSQNTSQKVTEDNQSKLTKKVPFPGEQMNDSLELRNVREKLLRLNTPDKIGYVYTFSYSGEVIDFYTVKGKISSNQSQMTVTDQVSYVCQVKPFLRPEDDKRRADNQICTWATVKSPGDDGSYGENEQGVFFFTTEDVFVQLSGTTIWRYYDAPIKVDSVTHKTSGFEAGVKPSSVGEPVDKRQG